MSQEDKKRKLLEKEIRALGIEDKFLIEKLVDEIDMFARIVMEAYLLYKKNK
jgi:hypothetical protein